MISELEFLEAQELLNRLVRGLPQSARKAAMRAFLKTPVTLPPNGDRMTIAGIMGIKLEGESDKDYQPREIIE